MLNSKAMWFILIAIIIGLVIYGALKYANSQVVYQYNVLAQKYELILDGNKSFGLLKDPFVTGSYQGKPIFIGSSSQAAFSFAHVGPIENRNTIYIIITEDITGDRAIDLEFSLTKFQDKTIPAKVLETASEEALLDQFLSTFEIKTNSQDALSKVLSKDVMKELLRLEDSFTISFNGKSFIYNNNIDMITDEDKRKRIEVALPVLFTLSEQPIPSNAANPK